MQSTDLVNYLNDGSDRRFRYLLAFVMGLTICNAYLPSSYDWRVLVPEPTQASEQLFEAQSTGSWAKRLQWIPLYLLAIYVIWIRRALVWHLLPRLNPFLLLFTLWATLSVLWSTDPGATLRRVIQVWGIILIAIAFCLAGWDRYRLVNVMRGTHSLLLIASLLFVVLIPGYGVHIGGSHDGAWRGVTTHKNAMGGLAAVSFLLIVHGWAGRHVYWYRALPMLMLALLFLVMARSSTSLLIGLASAPLVWVLARPPVSSEGWLLKTVLVVSLVAVLPLHFYTMIYGFPTFTDIIGPIAELFGKDVTLTGRSDIWELMWVEISRHPLEGAGYGAFWLGAEGGSGEIAQKLNFYPGQAHNGYIDILNETGLVGFVLMMLFLATHFVQMARTGFDRSNFSFYFATFAVMLVWNMTESSLFRTITNWLVISIVSSIVVSRARSALQQMPVTRTVRRQPAGLLS